MQGAMARIMNDVTGKWPKMIGWEWDAGTKAMEACTETRRILGYCKDALQEIKAEDPTGARWERHWTSLMALLRTTCEVLRSESPNYWDRHMEKPNAHIRGRDPKRDWAPQIYGKFIWTDANLILHQGILTVGQSRMVFLTGVSAQASVAGEKISPLPPPSTPTPPQTIYRMNTGHYKGHDPLDLADKAIGWLEQQIAIAET